MRDVSYKHRTYGHVSIWIGAITVGIAAVLYARLINYVQSYYLVNFSDHPLLMIFWSPFIFVIATALVRKLAPEAKGSGIPQVLEAIDGSTNHGLTSIKTAVVKVFSSAVGILGGASIGREGPTVQISASVFTFIGKHTKKWASHIDSRSYLVAGASAGVAAAFNTPIAGITFALEELADGSFGPFKQTVMLSVIIAGITAQALLGDYLYFGHPLVHKPNISLLLEAIAIGLVGGCMGGLFARTLAFPKFTRLPKNWWLRALICGLACGLIGYYTRGDTAGSGYEITNSVLSSNSTANASLLFPFWKMLTTTLSYLSGMAGGIFSPCLSIGAGLGITFAKIAQLANFKSCALIGMTAFFSGVVQAPLTAVIIVMEMTDERVLIFPLMISAFIAHAIGKIVMPIPLYRVLATRGKDIEK